MTNTPIIAAQSGGEPDKRGLPLDGFAIDRHRDILLCRIKGKHLHKIDMKLLKVVLNKSCP